jgi:HPt (histidine-containing phosphotransfer) domain-containing protein
MSGSLPVLDSAPLVELRALETRTGRGGRVDGLIQMFLDGLDGRATGIHQAVDAADARTLGRLAHALKGSCGTLGARRLAALAQELEHAGAAGDASPPGLAQLDTEVAALKAALAVTPLPG